MRLDSGFFRRDVLEVAHDLIGKTLVRNYDQQLYKFIVTEVEAYGGIEDQASHARFGKTRRNAVMFEQGGLVYVYLIYGMYWMLNVVTGMQEEPQAILIRGLEGISGPGKLTKKLFIDKSFYGEDLSLSNRIWFEENDNESFILRQPRYGIDYAQEPWKSMPWRFIKAPLLQNS